MLLFFFVSAELSAPHIHKHICSWNCQVMSHNVIFIQFDACSKRRIRRLQYFIKFDLVDGLHTVFSLSLSLSICYLYSTYFVVAAPICATEFRVRQAIWPICHSLNRNCFGESSEQFVQKQFWCGGGTQIVETKHTNVMRCHIL